jgi:hypothetical protein
MIRDVDDHEHKEWTRWETIAAWIIFMLLTLLNIVAWGAMWHYGGFAGFD